MFDHIGSKVMGLAVVTMAIGLIVSVIAAIVEWVYGLFFTGFLTLILGCLGSWIGSWMIYAIGYIADNSERNQKKMDEMSAVLYSIQKAFAAGMPVAAVQATQSAGSEPRRMSADTDGVDLTELRAYYTGAQGSAAAEAPAAGASPSPANKPKYCPSCGVLLWGNTNRCSACSAEFPG